MDDKYLQYAVIAALKQEGIRDKKNIKKLWFLIISMNGRNKFFIRIKTLEKVLKT